MQRAVALRNGMLCLPKEGTGKVIAPRQKQRVKRFSVRLGFRGIFHADKYRQPSYLKDRLTISIAQTCLFFRPIAGNNDAFNPHNADTPSQLCKNVLFDPFRLVARTANVQGWPVSLAVYNAAVRHRQHHI